MGTGAWVQKASAVIAVAFTFQGCTTVAGQAGSSIGQSRPISSAATIERAGTWQVAYHLGASAPVWLFPNSWLAEEDGRSWRVGRWTVMTEGVRLERIGNYDVLLSDHGSVPRDVQLKFEPYAKGIHNDYDPALAFSDGSVALFAQHFEVRPMPSRAAVEALAADQGAGGEAESPTVLSFKDSTGKLHHAGRQHTAVTLSDGRTYVMFSKMAPVSADGLTTFIDPGMPEWIRLSLTSAVRSVFSRYTNLFGPPPGMQPTLLASWAGPKKNAQNFSGHTLPGQIIMRFEGEGLLENSRGARARYTWLTAHEAAHFWLGQAVRYSNVRDSWITEGGADLLAFRTMKSIDPTYDVETEIAKSIDECAKLTVGRGVESAFQRNEFRAYYSCGVVLGLVAERATGQPFEAFVKDLLAANRTKGSVSRDEWLKELGPAASKEMRKDLETLLDTGSDEPSLLISRLLSSASQTE